jgi:hypothetical protein
LNIANNLAVQICERFGWIFNWKNWNEGEKNIPIYDKFIVDINCNVRIFIYAIYAHKYHWIGWNGRNNNFKQAISTMTGKITIK